MLGAWILDFYMYFNIMGASIIPKQPQDGSDEFAGVIQHGDNVAIYERPDAIKCVTIDADGTYQSRDGLYEMKVGY
jgi:hypothetical protein